MRHPTLTAATTIALTLLAAGGAHAHGDTRCDSGPPEAWRPQMELQRKLAAEGWKVRRVKTTNACYEVYAFDAAGERVEAFFDPRSFERVDKVPEAKR